MDSERKSAEMLMELSSLHSPISGQVDATIDSAGVFIGLPRTY